MIWPFNRAHITTSQLKALHDRIGVALHNALSAASHVHELSERLRAAERELVELKLHFQPAISDGREELRRQTEAAMELVRGRS